MPPTSSGLAEFKGNLWDGFRKNALPSVYVRFGSCGVTFEDVTLDGRKLSPSDLVVRGHVESLSLGPR